MEFNRETFCPVSDGLTIEQSRNIESIHTLKKAFNAVILVHNYQRPEIYHVADYIGDSLELSRKAAETDADIIVFCGVKFMAETAKILNPPKHVLLPQLGAICSLADMADVDSVRKMKEEYPDAAVVSYINTNADVKALSDICCTSANAVKVINSLPNKRIIFLPDGNLGRYVRQFTDKELILWEGHCVVHSELNKERLLGFKEAFPDCKVIAHPECKPDILEAADYISGTGGMAMIAEKDESENFIVVTECGMVHRLRQQVPGKTFYSFCNFCPYMKVTDLTSVFDSLLFHRYEITMPNEILYKAKESITRMLQVN